MDARSECTRALLDILRGETIQEEALFKLFLEYKKNSPRAFRARICQPETAGKDSVITHVVVAVETHAAGVVLWDIQPVF
jgi:hypothetical protein